MIRSPSTSWQKRKDIMWMYFSVLVRLSWQMMLMAVILLAVMLLTGADSMLLLPLALGGAAICCPFMTIIVLLFGWLEVDAPPSCDEIGKLRWESACTVRYWSDGRLYFTSLMVVFIPGAFLLTGRCSNNEQSIYIPLVEIQRVEIIGRFIFPQLKITRASGDIEVLYVRKPKRWIALIEAEKALMVN